jgi:uncharacterized protein
MSLKNKLNRMCPHLKSEADKLPLKQTESVQFSNLEIPYLEEWKKEQASPYYFDENYCLIREISYPLTYQYGKYQFHELKRVVHDWNQSSITHPLSAKGHKPEDLFFFDTETTGLGGGTGNTIFLLGHASLSETELILKQHILPHPGAEIPFYQSFLESIDYTTLVTYNGKAFDWPQVKTRHTLIREHVPKLPHFGHFDLYHASRRMWKHKLERLKLTSVEKDILGIERMNDIPGFLAPMIYFDFLETKNPEGLLGIIKHNELDILSLVTLYIHLSLQLLRLDDEQSSKETYEVGRWYASLGESSAAKSVFSDLVDKDKPNAIHAMHALAFECKKSKDWDQALMYWLEVAAKGTGAMQMEACIELAKIYEHKKKDLQAGIKYSKLAQELHFNKNNEMKEGFQEEIEKRINRLEKKITKMK